MKDKIANAGEWLVKWGYVIRGWLYASIGWLAIDWASGHSQVAPGGTEAIARASENPWGKLAVFLIIIGLIAYACWSLIRMWRADALIKKFGYLCSAIGYFAFVGPVTGFLFLNHAITSTGWSQLFNFSSNPVGRILIIVAGVAVVVGGVMQIVLAQELDTLGRIGTSTRAVLIFLAGAFIVLAGIKVDPSQPGGYDQALLAVGKWPFGHVLVMIMGIGLIALGLYSLTLAKKAHVGTNLN